MQGVDWLNRPIALARSAGGVVAVRDPWRGLMRGDVTPWPPPELVQKLYQSRQQRAYVGAHLDTVCAAHGFYADLQSLHSEDALTWSLFGLLAYADANQRAAYAAELLSLILGEAQPPEPAHLWLWRRLPHPDTGGMGGPEIDAGLQTARVLVLVEAKWRSKVGAGQGVAGDKDQIRLRAEFCARYGHRLFPGVARFIVLLVGPRLGALTDAQRALSTDRVTVTEATWQQLGALTNSPWRTEFLAYLAWRQS